MIKKTQSMAVVALFLGNQVEAAKVEQRTRDNILKEDNLMQTANEVISSTDLELAVDIVSQNYNDVDRYYKRAYPTKDEFAQVEEGKFDMKSPKEAGKQAEKGAKTMKKFKSKALKKKGKKSKVVSDDETEEEKALTKKALKDKPKSTIEKEDSDDEVAEASDKSSDAAEFSDGEYIPAKKSVANDSESEDDLKAKMEKPKELKADGTKKSAFKKMKNQKKLNPKAPEFNEDPVRSRSVSPQSGSDSDGVVSTKERTARFETADEYDHYAKFNHMSRKQALKQEALAAKKEHKARMALAHADSQQEAIRAQQQISQAEAMKKTASSFIKNQQIDGEIASEKQALMAERATDSEMRAVNKLKSYQSADQSVEDTSIVPETENMKQFFKTSNIYKKYQQEKVDEGQEDQMNQETEESVAELKTKFINLQSKYSALQDKVEQQNDLAMRLQSQIDTHNQYAKKQGSSAFGQPGPAMTAGGHPTPSGAMAKPKKSKKKDAKKNQRPPVDQTHVLVDAVQNNTMNATANMTTFAESNATLAANVSANVTANVTANVSSNTSANISANSTANVSANASANATSNITANVSANSTANASANATAFVFVNSTSNATANISANVSANASANVTANNTANISSNATQFVQKNVSVAANKTANISANATSNKTVNVSANITSNSTVNVTRNATLAQKNITGNNTANLTRNMTANMTGNVSSNATGNKTVALVAKNATSNVTVNASKNVSVNASKNVSQNATANATKQAVKFSAAQKNVTANISANSTANITANASANVTSNVSGNASANATANATSLAQARIDPHDGGQQHARHPEGLAPEPRSIDNKPEIHQQLKKPLIPENRNEDNDFMNAQIDPHDGGQQHARHPEGLAPEPRSIDNKPEIHQQLKKPLIPENRNEDNDFMNVGIDPHDGGQQHARHPEGLAPEPRSIDNKPEIHQQLKKPLIPENRKDTDDFMNMQIDPHDGGQQHARHPEGLAPEPRSIDNKPEIHQQLKKPLIPENRNEDNDFMNAQLKNIKAPASRTLLQLSGAIFKNEYPSPDIRGPMPENAHPDSTFSSGLHNDWTHVQLSATDYPTPEQRGEVAPSEAAYWGQPENYQREMGEYVQLSAQDYPTPMQRGEEMKVQEAYEGQPVDQDKRLFDFEEPGDY